MKNGLLRISVLHYITDYGLLYYLAVRLGGSDEKRFAPYIRPPLHYGLRF